MDVKISSKRAATNEAVMPAALGFRRGDSPVLRYDDRRPVTQRQGKVQALADASGKLSRIRSFSSMAEERASSAIDSGKGVVQGYFRKRGTGGLDAFFAAKASQTDIDTVYDYLASIKAPELGDEFLSLSDSTKDEGTLEDWVETSTGHTLDSIKRLAQIPGLKTAHPQIGPIPNDWIAATDTHNPGGPPITVVAPSILSSEFLGPPVGPGMRPPNSLVIDLSQPTFNYTPPKGQTGTYTISEDTRQHVMSGAMLENSFVDYRASQGFPPLFAQNTSGISVTASALTRKERKKRPALYPSSETIVAHRPDKVWTGHPQSPMGFQPITNHANTLAGDMHNLGGKVASKASLGGVVIVHEDGNEYRPTLEAFNSQVEMERAMDEYYRERDQEDEERMDEILFLMNKYKSTEVVSKMTGMSELEIEEIVAGAKSSEEEGAVDMDV